MKSIKEIKLGDWGVILFWIVLTTLVFNWHKNTVTEYEQKLSQHQELIKNSVVTTPQFAENMTSVSFGDNKMAALMMSYTFEVQGKEYKGFFGRITGESSADLDFKKVHYLAANPEINAISPTQKLMHVKKQKPTNFRKYLLYGLIFFTIATIIGAFKYSGKNQED